MGRPINIYVPWGIYEPWAMKGVGDVIYKGDGFLQIDKPWPNEYEERGG